MRCWIMSDKRWGDSSEERYEVEWQTKHPTYDDLSAQEKDCFDPARHPFHTEGFRINKRVIEEPARREAHAAALVFAKKVAADSFFGCATVTRQILEHIDDDAFDWTASAESASEEILPD